MNLSVIFRELDEARIHLTAICDQLGNDDTISEEMDLATILGHVVSHISLAWTLGRMPKHISESLSQATYDDLCDAVPNFTGTMRMLEGWDVID